MYDLRYDVSGVTVFGAWIKGWTRWSFRGTALGNDSVAVPLDISFNRCTGELSYVSRLAVNIVCYAGLGEEEFTTHSLNYVALMSPFD